MEMLFTRQKAREDANLESPPITQPEINILEVCTPIRKVFTQEQNELLVQQVLQDAQDLEGEVLNYHALCLNYYSTDDDLKKSVVNWLFNLTLTKISIHRLLLIFA